MEWGAGATPLSAEFWFHKSIFKYKITYLMQTDSKFVTIFLSFPFFFFFFFFCILMGKELNELEEFITK